MSQGIVARIEDHPESKKILKSLNPIEGNTQVEWYKFAEHDIGENGLVRFVIFDWMLKFLTVAYHVPLKQENGEGN